MAMELLLCKVIIAGKKLEVLLFLLYLRLCQSLESRECIRAKRRGEYWNILPAVKKIPFPNEAGEQKSLTGKDLARLRILFWWGFGECVQSRTSW